MQQAEDIKGRFASRLKEVAEIYQQGDSQLALRRLMDAAIDTANTDIFDAVTAHIEWLENANPDEAQNWETSQTLLNRIAAAGVAPRTTFGERILEASGVRKRYTSRSFELGPVDTVLARGEMLGLVGENGNGKTTLLRILAQELSVDEGSIEYFLPQSGNAYDLRSKLAYIPQRTPKWFGSLMDNLKFTLSCYGVKGQANESYVLMMVARMGLWKYKNMQWNELSSGYKMRFELARTFLRRPDILLLDEPLANLDMQAQQTILEDLKSLAGSLANPIGVVLSSQQLYEVEKVSDRVLFLRRGQPLWQDQRAADPGDVLPPEHFIIEFETQSPREELQAALAKLSVEKISFNGGTYVAQFPVEVTMPAVMEVLVSAGISLLYIRDISKSTRRFFVQS
ncbi:ATP-binding cassette domain-containing protein [Rurimicrobium arvi]|uniref:ABC transporter domain-containing protein n=1 Tax=Rurimicrobium arvi TaxID=2049916 RepID=A0ABP8MI86_9BACT